MSWPPEVKGQNTRPLLNTGRTIGEPIHFHSHIVKGSCQIVVAFDSGYIFCHDWIRRFGINANVIAQDVKEKTRCDNVSSIINRVASSLFFPRQSTAYRPLMGAGGDFDRRSLWSENPNSERRAKEPKKCISGRKEPEKMKRSRRSSLVVSLSRRCGGSLLIETGGR